MSLGSLCHRCETTEIPLTTNISPSSDLFISDVFSPKALLDSVLFYFVFFTLVFLRVVVVPALNRV